MTNFTVNDMDLSPKTFPIHKAEIIQANFPSIREVSFYALYNSNSWKGLLQDYGVALWRVKLKPVQVAKSYNLQYDEDGYLK